MTIALLTEDGRHLGFVMCHLDERRGGRCAFSIVPTEAALFEDPAALLLFRRREVGESRFEISGEGGGSIRIESPGLPGMRIELDEAGLGTWGEGDGDFFKVVGTARCRQQR